MEIDIGNFCQICVDTNVKMYHEKQHNLDVIFQDLMGPSIPKIQYGNYFCYLCAGILYKFVKFRERYVLGQMLLKKMFQSRVTLESIQDAHRKLATLFFSGTLIEIDQRPQDFSLHESHFQAEPSLLINPLEDTTHTIKEEEDTVAASTFLNELDIKPNETSNKSEILLTCNVQGNSTDSVGENNYIFNEETECVIEERDQVIVIESDNEHSPQTKPTTKKQKPKSHHMKYLLQRSRAHKFDEKHWKVIELSDEEMYEDFREKMNSAKCKDSVYQCDLCFRWFLKEDTLARHVRVHSKSRGEYECTLCRRRFTIKGTLRAHMKIHRTRYHCLQCPFVGRSAHMAIRHEKYHSGLQFKCKLCNISFTNLSTYYTHRKVLHRSSHVCAACGGSFVSAAGLRQHCTIKHSKGEGAAGAGGSCHFCDRCHIDFKTPEAFEEHKIHSALHLDDDKQGDKQKQLKSKKRDYKCNHCDATFSSRCGRHRRRVHACPAPAAPAAHAAPSPPALICERCGLAVSYSSIATHRKKHAKEALLTGEGRNMQQHDAPEKSFSCDNCGRKFLRRNRLTFHLKLARCTTSHT